MAIDLENRTIQGLNAFAAFVLLNLLYLLSCLPVVTVGAATSALLGVTMRYADEERGRLLRDYLRGFVKDFPRATVVHLILGIPILALFFAARFWSMLDGPLSLAAAVIAVLAALYLFGAWIHATALVAGFRAPLARVLRTALLLPGAEPLRTAGLVLVPAALLVLALVVPGAVWVLLTIGASVGGYVAALLLRSVHRRYGPAN